MRQQALIGALIVVGGIAPAVATQLGGDELKSAVAGKTVTIDTPLGLPITVNYGANGMMTGTAGTALAVYLGSAKDRGRWHVRDGKLCQKWFKWLSGDMSCLTLRQDGRKIFWRSDEGQSGTAMIETGPPAFDGVVASGLGLPLPPKKEAPAAAAPPAPDADEDVQSEKSWKAATAVQKPAVHVLRRAASVAHAPAPREHDETSSEPRLVHAIAPAPRPIYAVASFAPSFRRLEAEATEPDTTPGAFLAPQVSMRRAADWAAQGMLEHRWCNSNAFAKGPTGSLSAGGFAAPEIASVPSLLAVAQEASYVGELPLHDASCMTEDPGINVLAKLPAQVE